MVGPRRFHLYAMLMATCGLVLSTSCSLTIQKRQQPTVQPAGDIAVSPNQIRLRMRSLVEPFAGEIEQTADAIVTGTSDRSVKRAAIQWKIDGVPAIRRTLFQPNPFTAVFDTWVFMFQMENYFKNGPGRTALGPAAAMAVEACLRMEAEINKVATSFTKSGDVSRVRALALQWATDHPIRYAIRDRETTLSRVTERDAGVKWGAGEVIAEMAVTADDLHREIQIYSDHLFRQARWEAELLMLNLPTEKALPLAERAVKSSEQVASTLNQMSPALATAANAAAIAAEAASAAESKLPSDISGLVSSERKAAIHAISSDLRQTLEFLQRERVATIGQIGEERMAIMKEVREIVSSERLALSRDIQQEGVNLVDHVAWRLAQIVAVTLAFVLLSALLLLFLIHRWFHSPAEPHGRIRNAA